MLETGETAPVFELPAAVGGTIETLRLEEVIDEGVLLLVFYPADFSPACTEELCSLRDLDLFSLQPDVALAAVSTDSAYSHRAFADEYSLGFPLFSDSDGSVAREYGVVADDPVRDHALLVDRSVFVLDDELTVHYAWTSEDPLELPDFDAIRAAIESVSTDETAAQRYREAHEWYREGREAYEAGMDAFEADDWLAAADEFAAAVDPLADAVEAFDAARRYATDDAVVDAAEGANEQATDRRTAAKWLASAANQYATGEVDAGDEFREDAAGPRENVADRAEPPEPAELFDDE